MDSSTVGPEMKRICVLSQVVLALVAACLAEPPAKGIKSIDSKDKRGVSSYDTSSSYSSGGHGSSISLPASSLSFGSFGGRSLSLSLRSRTPAGYGKVHEFISSGIGHAPLLLSGSGLGLFGGHSYGLASPIALGGHTLALAQPIVLAGGHGSSFGGLGKHQSRRRRRDNFRTVINLQDFQVWAD